MVMIEVTRLDNSPVIINAQLIATVEATPDTVITLTTERKVVVRESVGEIVRRAIEYLGHVYRAAAPVSGVEAGPRWEEAAWTSRPSSD
jgi:flagellar protein FlbD